METEEIFVVINLKKAKQYNGLLVKIEEQKNDERWQARILNSRKRLLIRKTNFRELNFRIVENTNLGRHAVLNRFVEAGELLFREVALYTLPQFISENKMEKNQQQCLLWGKFCF